MPMNRKKSMLDYVKLNPDLKSTRPFDLIIDDD